MKNRLIRRIAFCLIGIISMLVLLDAIKQKVQKMSQQIKVKFTDGTEFNAEIVKKNFDEVLQNKSDHSFLESINLIEAVDVVDEYTMKIKYTEAYYPVLQELALSRPVRIMAESLFPEEANTSEGIVKPIGTGMWKLKEYKPGQYAILYRNEEYLGEAPKFSEIKIVFTPDGDTFVNLLKAGDVDMIFDVESRLTPNAFKEIENRALNILKEMKIQNSKTVLDSYPYQLSGGMLQLTLILRLIII